MAKTARRTWKLFEQRVASFFGSRRTPLSGSASAHTASDTLHQSLFIECKLRQHFGVVNLFDEIETRAKRESKIPILAIQEKNRKGWLLLCRPGDIHAISNWAKDYENLPEIK